MRLHTDHLTAGHVRAAAALVPGLEADVTEHRSSIRERALEVRLYADDRGPGRRLPNGASYGQGGPYAAMWDEWGIVMGALYGVDDDAVWGSPKHPTYADSDAFDEITGYRFADVADVWTARGAYNPGVLAFATDHGERTGRFELTQAGQRVLDTRHTHRWEWAGRNARELTCKGTPSKGIVCTAELNRF